MSSKHNIDQLFESKLKGRDAGGYNATAWQGAESLLDQHYRAIFWKKLIGFGIAASVVVTLGLWVGTTIDTSSESTKAIGHSESPEMKKQDFTPSTTTKTSEPRATSAQKNALPVTEKSIAQSSDSESRPQIDNSKETVRTDDKHLTAASHVQDKEDVVSTSDSKTVAPTSSPSQVSFSEAAKSRSDDNEDHSKIFHNSSNKNTFAQIKIQSSESNVTMAEMPSLSFHAFNVNGSDSIEFQAGPEKEVLMNQLRKVDVAIQIGGQGVSGFQNLSNTKAKLGFGWHAGLIVTYHLNADFYARGGAILNGRNALASRKFEKATVTGKLYSAPKNLMYLDIPLEFGYNFGARHSVYFGMAISPLVGYFDNEQRTTLSADDGSETITEEVSKGLGRDGFAAFDMAGMLGYKFQLTERIDALAELKYGLFDMTDNSYFGTALIDDRNHQLRIGLNYRFLSR